MTLEQTCKAIGALSNYGIKASQAGTTFRRILVNLADKSVQRRLQGLGVIVQDMKTGNMRDVASILKDLGVATQKIPKGDKLTFFKEIFGVWAMAGGASLTTAEFERLYDAVDNAGGIARRTAKDMDLGLAGSLRMLWSAVEGVAIAIGEALNPVLQPLVDWMTKVCSGMVVYITNNKQLIVTISKTITAIIGTGIALFALGTGFRLSPESFTYIIAV
ncbi:MAG: phage tail tape measure protein [Planctomycetaceae bacterium]|nr:phage tail tape measure protein [Planctomycetaceae bacterium]